MLIGIERTQLKGLEKELAASGFILDKETSLYGACRKVPGNTEEEWSWHYQFITTDKYTEKDFYRKMKEIGNVLDTWENKLDAPITFNAGLCEDGRITIGVDIREKFVKEVWAGYNLKKGERADAFKQYLRDRGLYFEPSEYGLYVHFEVKYADKDVDRFVEELISGKKVKDSTKMTKEELLEKHGTDNVDLINAGKPEKDRVELKDEDLGDSQHRLQDMNADEIIAIMKEAGEKGRSWEWLKGKLPTTFLNLWNKQGAVFPMQVSTPYSKGNGTSEGVHLTKPKNKSENIDWQFLPEYLELKKESDALLDKYVIKNVENLEKEIKKVYEEEDSISKRLIIKKDLDLSKSFYQLFNDLVHKYNFFTDYWGDYNYRGMMHRDFVFDKKKYVEWLNSTWENRDFKKKQKKFLIKDPYGNEITNLSQKVGPITPEVESYIRRVLGETTTEEIDEKREVRRANRPLSKYDLSVDLNKWAKDREDLKALLREFKKVSREGTFEGLTYEPERPKMIYQKGAGYDYRGRWVGFSKGDYRYAHGEKNIPAQVKTKGYSEERELFAEVTKALTLAMNSKTVADLKLSIEEALEAVRKLPSDDEKIKEARQKIENFLKERREEFKQRAATRVKKLPDRKYKEQLYIYLFPAEMSKRDLKSLSLYDLVYLGKNFFEGDMSHCVKGTKENLEAYAEDYLGYQLHPDFLYEEDEFAGDIV